VIERRARYFRNQVVAVVLVGVTSLGWALVAWSLTPLVGLTLLFPISAFFLFADAKLLELWRSELLKGWVTGSIDVAAFCHAIRAHPALPPATLDSMLLTLPSAGDLVAEQRLTVPTRRAIAAAVLATYRSRSDTMALKAAASAIVSLGFVLAVTIRSWVPFLVLGSLVLVPVVQAWMKRRRVAESERAVAACRTQPGFSELDYVRVRAGVR
jgi:hypothetical protein